MAALGAPGEIAPNSIRAFHYKPGLHEALTAVAKAVSANGKLSQVTATELVVVVSARNGCFY
jgi:hypothetical protein